MTFQVTRKSAARLPNSVAHTVRFKEMSASAIKAFFYVTARFQKEQQNVVSFTWSELDGYLSNRVGGPMAGKDYVRCVQALNGVLGTTVTFVNSEETHSYNFFSNWKLNHNSHEISVWMNPRFKKLLAEMGVNFYTLVYLEEAKKLDDPRQLRMLMWCYEFKNIREEGYRRLSLKEIKSGLQLTSDAYHDWRRVSDKLRGYAQAINNQTSINLRLTPIKEGKQVVAVQFDVTDKRRRITY